MDLTASHYVGFSEEIDDNVIFFWKNCVMEDLFNLVNWYNIFQMYDVTNVQYETDHWILV